MRVAPNPTWNESLVKERTVETRRRSGVDLYFEIVDQGTSLPSGKKTDLSSITCSKLAV